MKHEDDQQRGLAFDIEVMRALGRRGVLKLMAGAGVLPVLGCGSDEGSEKGSIAGSGNTGGSSGSGDCTALPAETAGPYPGDGSNGPNALALSGIVRSDIRASLGDLSGTAEGVLLTVTLKLVDTNAGCAALAGYAVYLWQCDRDAQYSMYTITNQNYLRGVQESGEDGTVTFTTIFPGCYPGRMPHLHFAVYASLASAASGGDPKTSQLAFPIDVCEAVYASDGYAVSIPSLAQISFETDGVFRDGAEQQIASVTGSVDSGYFATLTVAIAG